MDFKNQVSSPTFSICNEYATKNVKIKHYDLYRLESINELEEIGIFEDVDSNDITVIEWVDKYPEIMNLCGIIVKIENSVDGLYDYEIEIVEKN